MRMLSHAVLVDAAMALDCVVQIDAVAKGGDQADALGQLSLLSAAVESYLPVMRGVIATEEQAAQAMDLTHHTLAPFFAAPPRREHTNAAQAEPIDERVVAIADVLNGRCPRAGVPGQWRVFWEDGRLIFEPLPVANDHGLSPKNPAPSVA